MRSFCVFGFLAVVFSDVMSVSVIAMGLPGETIDKVWRNDADAVADFFNTYHKYVKERKREKERERNYSCQLQRNVKVVFSSFLLLTIDSSFFLPSLPKGSLSHLQPVGCRVRLHEIQPPRRWYGEERERERERVKGKNHKRKRECDLCLNSLRGPFFFSYFPLSFSRASPLSPLSSLPSFSSLSLSLSLSPLSQSVGGQTIVLRPWSC